MPTYYCSNCAAALGLKQGIDLSTVLGTTYQADKFQKHTSRLPSTSYPTQTVFDSNSTQYYADCISEAVNRGFVEIDDQSRKNVIFCPSTGSAIGSKYKWGQLASRVDSVVVVKTSEADGIHALLDNSSSFSTGRCATCGRSLI